MQKVSGIWQGGKKVEVTLDPDLKIVFDENGPKATDLVLAGLVRCCMGVFQEILEKMRLEVKGLEIDVQAERDTEPPKLFSKITLNYHIEAEEGLEQKLVKAAQLGEKYCTVYNILKESTQFEVFFFINGVKLLNFKTL
ncbi:putative redox protein, regulator of disulfide bond formation [Desulfitobacterium dichloroeliminans LMG P-21439]|uniref:Putative redox protein, regulator of disulfide bond formation n=1 Tax=Desulfitobacterium dichloroeliminans (strain LMG P-21439 / DCA1) TaxID=871963 RepID=L0F346_DESDL|nr:OsmC family protein [Desulfitobacterium dichloroeliminans]AGA68274.1 putative redox protein, regulator of disulfide bond formation [Desulfitobacterium dichloroeliminans LMG P-21439]